MGRTGIRGRGVLDRYGPNHRCTAVITRLFSSYIQDILGTLFRAA